MTDMRRGRAGHIAAETVFYLIAVGSMLLLVFLRLYGEIEEERIGYQIVELICETGRLPEAADVTGLLDESDAPYAFLPALTYLAGGWLLRLIRLITDRFDVLLISARLLNVAFGIGAAFYTRKLSRLLFGESAYQWLFSCLVVFSPPHLLLYTYVNAAAAAVFAVLALFTEIFAAFKETHSVEGMQSVVFAGAGPQAVEGQYGMSVGRLLRMAAAFILCLLSTPQAYGAALLFFILLLACFTEHLDAGVIGSDGTAAPSRRHRIAWRAMARWILPLLLLILAGSGWWFVLCFLRYSGSGLLAVTAAGADPVRWIGTLTDAALSLPEQVYGILLTAGLVCSLLPVGGEYYLDWLKREMKWITNGCLLVLCLLTLLLSVLGISGRSVSADTLLRSLLAMLPAVMYFVTMGLRKLAHLLSLLADAVTEPFRSRYRAGTVVTSEGLSNSLPGAIGRLGSLGSAAMLLYTIFILL